MQSDTYLLRFGEVALKGKNRDRFVSNLIKTIKTRITPLEGTIEKGHKRLLVHCKADPALVKKALSTVFGLTSISPIWRTEVDLDAIHNLCWTLMEPKKSSGKSFAVRVKRPNKRFPMTSSDLQINIAGEMFNRGVDLPVDLKNPELKLGITVGLKEAWVYLESWPGLGGLPISPYDVHGLLLSGGIDSPVAGNMIQKRGGTLEAIYFHTPPYTVEAAKDKVIDLAKILASYQAGLKLHVVNFTEVMKTLKGDCKDSYTVVLSRRIMMRVASQIMEKSGGKSLVTGENLGQVASQTIENIAVINQNVPYPILRPLIGLDKLEIIDRSKKLGAYEISIQPFEDCCSLFSPQKPVTKAKMDQIEKEESRINIEQLVTDALALTEVIELN